MANKEFTENTRVQVPAALHLCRLGYTYLSAIKDDDFDDKTNILKKIFIKSVCHINKDKDLTEAQAESLLNDLIRISANDDLGREFYQHLSTNSGIKLIDFDHPEENEWHVTTEFTCEDRESGDNFRPDITCFINGIPVCIIEVKKPNNRDGILAERDRINKRMAKKVFRTFFNVTQLMIFSNNQEYDHEGLVPIQGAFYATTSKKEAFFNVFREADDDILAKSGYNPELPDGVEKQVLTHRNCIPIKESEEYKHNQRPDSPTNRIITSMLSRERILFLLRYGFAYVDKKEKIEVDGKEEEREELQKHIMRYQQMFASMAIRKRLEDGGKSGIIWHTQGSGKTALAFYNVKYLTDYYATQGIAAKFYFIVDRIDLMEQASTEFAERGLLVRQAQDRDSLMADFRDNNFRVNAGGKPEIMVVNIQKFKEDHKKVSMEGAYNTKLQRIFFIDEAHRGYRADGSFLANLLEADKDSVKIALTGTPLLKEEAESWRVFGDYIDKYYYDKSISDGYTLKLMREDIETSYKEKITQILERLTQNVEVKPGDVKHSVIIESDKYLNSLLEYIIHDMRRSRIHFAAPAMAGMIVCETNRQARNLYDLFQERFKPTNLQSGEKPMRAQLILHDEDDKTTRKSYITEYKRNESIDFLIVNAMLLTGFDAARLKKLYLCRKLDGHNLLQALTRVNRPYRDFKYGYVVDFANIKENFIETNNLYLKELNRTNEDSTESQNEPPAGDILMAAPEEIKAKMDKVKDTLWPYDCENKEVFREQLDEITDNEVLYTLRTALETAKSLVNQVRSYGDEALKKKIEELKPGDLNDLLKEVNHRIERNNLLNSTDHSDDVTGIIREAISQIEFEFRKKGQEELEIIYNDLKERYDKVREEFEANFDKQKDPVYVSLADEFKKYFRKRGFQLQDVVQAKEEIGYMDTVMERIRAINRANEMLKRKYNDDESFARIHKRIREENEKRSKREPKEKPIISDNERELAEELSKMKEAIDAQIFFNVHILNNEEAFGQDVLKDISLTLVGNGIAAPVSDKKAIRREIVSEYMARYSPMRMAANY